MADLQVRGVEGSGPARAADGEDGRETPRRREGAQAQRAGAQAWLQAHGPVEVHVPAVPHVGALDLRPKPLVDKN